MCWFSWIYEHKTAGFSSQFANQSRNGIYKMMDSFGYYVIYVTNILTNHGINQLESQNIELKFSFWLKRN